MAGAGAATHQELEFVQQMIGRKGVNKKRISKSAGSVACLMGEGSGHREQEGQLRLVVMCPTQENENLALRLTTELFDNLNLHFSKFCRKKRLPPARLYKIISLEEGLTFG
ncbi:unnamed protein product, partial [Effrenium voratum]